MDTTFDLLKLSVIIFSILDPHPWHIQAVFPCPPSPMRGFIRIGFAIDACGLHALGKERAKLRGFTRHFSNSFSGFFRSLVGACKQRVKRELGHSCSNALRLGATDLTEWRVWRLKDRSDIVFALAMADEIDHFIYGASAIIDAP